MNSNNIYIATKSTDYTYIFEPYSMIGDKIIGHKGNIATDPKHETTFYDGDNHHHNWVEEHWSIKLASAAEAQWYLACRAAGKLVEKPKVIDSYPIF